MTDTTAGTATLNCGVRYTLKTVAQNAVQGDNSKIDSIERGAGAALNADGTVSFTPTDATYYLKVVGSQHGVVEFRILNIDNNAYRYASGLAAEQGWNLTGVDWNGTTANESVITVAASGRFTDEVHFRSNGTDTDFADFGYWILIDANTSAWNEPTVKLDGVTLVDNKGQMTTAENRLLGSLYEYAYKVHGDVTDSEHVARLEFSAVSGINPSDLNSPTFALASIGHFKATSSSAVLEGAATDAATAAAVYTIQTANLHIA